MKKKVILAVIAIILVAAIGVGFILAIPKAPTPTEPTTPTTEGTKPTEPGSPTDPDVPTKPTEPVVPTDPDVPTKPTEPVVPTDPTNPTEPVGPTDPTTPDEPTDPTQPDTPTDPTEPAPHEHKYAEEIIAPTCTETGYIIFTCECGHTYQGNESEALGHNYSKKVVDATCDKGGYSHYTCSRCGHEYDGDETEPRGHKMGDWEVSKEATCTEAGSKTRKCERCSHSEKETVPAKGHEFAATKTVDATCTEAGYIESKCTACNETTKQEIPAKGHTWGGWKIIKNATCTEKGREEHKCSGCGKTEQRDIPANGHDWILTDGKAPTCTEPGYREKKCDACGTVAERETIPAKGHTWRNWDVIRYPTETEDGLQQRTCFNCSEVEIQTIDHNHKHEIVKRVVPGEGCVQNDFNEWYCKICGYIDGREGIPFTAPGHKWTEWKVVKQPGPGVAGEKQRRCTVCGEIESLPIEPLGDNGKELVSYIDPKVEQSTAIGGFPYYSYGKIRITDYRTTWGDYLSIVVNADNSVTVKFVGKTGKMIEIVMKVMENYDLTILNIKEDGTWDHYGFNGFH